MQSYRFLLFALYVYLCTFSVRASATVSGSDASLSTKSSKIEKSAPPRAGSTTDAGFTTGELADDFDAVSLSRENYKSMLIGHNITPTTYTLKKGVSTVGFYAIALGVTDQILIGTSPWIEGAYNMHNFHVRYAGKIAQGQRLAVGGSYFRSHDDAEYATTSWGERYVTKYHYKQESYTGQLTHSIDVSPVYTIHSCLSYMYYADDERPYSLRMQPFSKDPNQVNLSVLHEARLTRHLGLNAEMGILGANYAMPYFHYAGSFVFQSDAWLMQAGISHSLLIAGPHDADPDQSFKFTDAVHPEIQAQYYF